MQALGLADQFEDTKDPKCSHHCSQGTHIDVEDELRDEANPGEYNDQKVKIVPPVLVIAGLIRRELYDHFDGVNDCKPDIDPFHNLSELFWLSEPLDREAHSVQNDASEDQVTKAFGLRHFAAKVAHFVASLAESPHGLCLVAILRNLKVLKL